MAPEKLSEDVCHMFNLVDQMHKYFMENGNAGWT